LEDDFANVKVDAAVHSVTDCDGCGDELLIGQIME
jgi:hypothetical protein